MSSDGTRGLTIIAFVGSVFSPYYAWARRRTPGGLADPQNHCALNVVFYGGKRSGWAMTERPRAQMSRDAQSLRIGPSALRWEGDTLTIDIDEVTMPLPMRIRGTVRVHAPVRFDHSFALAPKHRWSPIAPAAQIEVDLGSERWSGNGYLDSNRGDEPLERAFVRWEWSRAHLSEGRSMVLYNVERRDADPLRLGLSFDALRGVTPLDMPDALALPSTRWRVPRSASSDAGTTARLQRTLTDAPFYARSLIDARWLGEDVTVMHESLSLDRFDTPWVRAMLPFRMPRRFR